MNYQEAQNDMRQAYYGGGAGVFASGFVWLVAGIAASISTQQTSLLIFFFGGMLIYPLGIVFSNILILS